jgi:phage baseplate assembly protein W
MQEYVYEALRLWEPRIEVVNVSIETEAGASGMLLALVEYVIKSTHDTRSIVYPFYIAEEPEI